jgi:hypothetical protein
MATSRAFPQYEYRFYLDLFRKVWPDKEVFQVDRDNNIASCYQCAGINYCYGTKSPGISREMGRSEAANCTSMRKGPPNETVSVSGYNRGLSRANAEKLVSGGYAKWSKHRTIEPIIELPVGIHNRLIKEQRKRQREVMVIQ